MYEQEDFDQKVGWFGGIFAMGGSLYITKWGTTSSNRDRFVLGATFSVHVSRKEIIDDFISIFEIGQLVEKEKTFYNRVVWQTLSSKEVEMVIELLDQVVWPLSTLLLQQMDIAKRFLATRLPPGRSRDIDLVEDVYQYRKELHEEMKALTEWKKSVGYKEDLDVKRLEELIRGAGGAGDPQL